MFNAQLKIKTGSKIVRCIDDKNFKAEIISVNTNDITICYEDDGKVEDGVSLDEIRVVDPVTGGMISPITYQNLTSETRTLNIQMKCDGNNTVNNHKHCLGRIQSSNLIHNADSSDDFSVGLRRPIVSLRRVKSFIKMAESTVLNLLPLAGSCEHCCKLTTFRCYRCSSAYYCTRKCQRIKWSQHQENCRLKSFAPFEIPKSAYDPNLQVLDSEDKRVRFSGSDTNGTITPPSGSASDSRRSSKQERFTAGDLNAAIASIKDRRLAKGSFSRSLNDPSEYSMSESSALGSGSSVPKDPNSVCDMYPDQSAVEALSDMLGFRVEVESDFRKVNAALLAFKDVNRAADWFLCGATVPLPITKSVDYLQSAVVGMEQSNNFDDTGTKIGGNGWDISATGDIILRPASQDYEDLPALTPCETSSSARISTADSGEPISLLTEMDVTIGLWKGIANVTQTSYTDYSMTIRIFISAQTITETAVKARSPYRLFLSAADVAAICSLTHSNEPYQLQPGGATERAHLVLQQLVEFRHTSEDGSLQYLGIQIECGSRAVCQSYGQEGNADMDGHGAWANTDSDDWKDDDELSRFSASGITPPSFQRGKREETLSSLPQFTVANGLVDEERQQKAMMLVEMLGVEMDRAAEILSAFNGDMEQSADWLLTSSPGAVVPGRSIVPFCGPMNENRGNKYYPAKVHPIDEDI